MIYTIIAKASSASSKNRILLDIHTNTFVVGVAVELYMAITGKLKLIVMIPDMGTKVLGLLMLLWGMVIP